MCHVSSINRSYAFRLTFALQEQRQQLSALRHRLVVLPVTSHPDAQRLEVVRLRLSRRKNMGGGAKYTRGGRVGCRRG